MSYKQVEHLHSMAPHSAELVFYVIPPMFACEHQISLSLHFQRVHTLLAARDFASPNSSAQLFCWLPNENESFDVKKVSGFALPFPSGEVEMSIKEATLGELLTSIYLGIVFLCLVIWCGKIVCSTATVAMNFNFNFVTITPLCTCRLCDSVVVFFISSSSEYYFSDNFVLLLLLLLLQPVDDDSLCDFFVSTILPDNSLKWFYTPFFFLYKIHNFLLNSFVVGSNVCFVSARHHTTSAAAVANANRL